MTTLRAWVLERSPLVVLGAIVAATLLNGLFSLVNTTLSLPLFLDTIFTLVVAALFGPVAGAVTGISSNAFQELIFGLTGTNWQFGLVNAASGFVVGLLARNGLFRTGVHVVNAVLVLTILNALLGSVVAMLVFGGSTGIEVDYIAMGLLLSGRPMFLAAFLARIPANLVDKAIAVLLAYLAYRVAFLHGDD